MTFQEAERQAFELRKDAEAEAVAEAASEQLEVEDRFQDVHAEGFRKDNMSHNQPTVPLDPTPRPPSPSPPTPQPPNTQRSRPDSSSSF